MFYSIIIIIIIIIIKQKQKQKQIKFKTPKQHNTLLVFFKLIFFYCFPFIGPITDMGL